MNNNTLPGKIVELNYKDKNGNLVLSARNNELRRFNLKNKTLHFKFSLIDKCQLNLLCENVPVLVTLNDNNPYQPIKKIVIDAEYKLPNDTKTFLPNRSDVENNYLLMHKFPLFCKKESKSIINGMVSKESCDAVNSFINNIHRPQRLKLIDDLQKSGYQLATKQLRVDGKLTIGLGQASVYEVSLNLDFLYGIPYIPASSIKGLLLSYYEKELRADKAKLTNIFGSENNRGKLMFLDAFPVSNIILGFDIMNPHYGDYYTSKGEVKPNDFMNPVPIFFPVVTNATFEFTIIVQKDNGIDENLEVVLDNLTNALSIYGIGAKTALGYGLFKQEISDKNQ